jgi:hypothetical protein
MNLADFAAELRLPFERQRAAFAAQPYPDWATRRDRLQRLQQLLLDNEAVLIAAIDSDFGGRPAAETQIAEIFPSLQEIKHALAHLPADRPPNAMQFRAACLAAPGTGELAALAYTAPPQTEQQRDVLRVTAGALAAQPLSPGRYCMERLQTFEDRTGRRLNPAQRFQLDALERMYCKPAEAAQEARA